MKNLKGKYCIVTGAGKGIGKAIAKRFLEEEAAGIAILEWNLELAEATAKELDPTGELFIADRIEVMGYDMTDTSLTKAEKKKVRKCFSYEVYKNTEQLATQLKCMADFLEDAARLTGV